MSSRAPGNRPDPAKVVFGWDVGGANVKVARAGAGAPGPVPVLERPFPLWRDPGQLVRVLREMAAELGGPTARMGVTMTAELADCFPTKRDGVATILESFQRAFPGAAIRVFGVDGEFRDIPRALEVPLEVAAANWMATAMLVARRFSDALLVDCGSTTTDIIPIVGGRVAARGKSDPERLTRGELVYTGIQRTPVCAILDSVSLNGGRCRVAAEVFAIAADAHRWLGNLDESGYTAETPDGRGRSRPDAARRLARMVCGDRDTLNDDQITAIAQAVVDRQASFIATGIRQVCDALGEVPRIAVPLGSGALLARIAVSREGLTVPEVAANVLPAGPAAAVATLLAEACGGGPAAAKPGPFGG